MNTPRNLSALVSITGLTLLSLCVACSSASAPPHANGEQKTTKEKETDKSDKTASTPPSPSDTETTTDPTTPADQSDDGDPAAEACWNTCVAATPGAAELAQKQDACWGACGENDEACFTKCETEAAAMCTPQTQALCDALGACETKCFPNQGGDEEG